ncbi:MAG TPA: ThiF family adenylyltransferase [Flavilitoribacter sp.]|nr:ThiF family adenylyltransferase [Flavilitoribacter sp.]
MSTTDTKINTSVGQADFFSLSEQKRYARHFALPGFGQEGQARLKSGSALVIGAGGLGCPALLYLAAAGVGRIGIVDGDRVEESNLQRQVLFTTGDLGKPKAEAAKCRIEALNPHIQVEAFDRVLNSENALDLIRDYDVIVDGSDNFPTRYLVNDACVILEKNLVYGAISAFEGQVAVFNWLMETGERSPNYRDLFPEPPEPGAVQNCEEGGVLGVLPGIIGSMQANEALKILSGYEAPLHSRLFIMDAATLRTMTLKFKKQYFDPIEKLIDYEGFCGVPLPGSDKITQMAPETFKSLMNAEAACFLVDVREPEEHDQGNLGGINIPLGVIREQAHLIPSDQPVVVYCQSGRRSRHAILQLQGMGFKNLLNLSGGMDGQL